MYMKPLTRRGENGIMILRNVEMLLDVEFYENMNRLIRQLIIKTIVVAVMVSVLIFVFFQMRPQYDPSDLYEISGTCIDVYAESLGKTGTMYYVTMDNENDYFVGADLREEIEDTGIGLKDLKGRHLQFCVADRFIFSSEIITWNISTEEKKLGLDYTNQRNAEARIVIVIMFSLLGFVPLTPSILRITQKRDQIKETAWRKKKREAEKQRFAEKQLESNGSSKKRPQNMSAKKWKKRHKRK